MIRRLLLSLMILTAILICGCGNEYKQINSIDDLKHARIAIWPGGAYELKARENFPDAQFFTFNTLSDLVQNLKQNKIDAFVIGKTYVDNFRAEGVDVEYLPQPLGNVSLSYIFPKNERGQQLCNQMNEFLSKLETNGELDALKEKWLRGDKSKRTFTKTPSTGENGKLIIATDGDSTPFVYVSRGEVIGYEAELFDKFCAAYGYDYETKIEGFLSMLADVVTNKADVGMNAIEKLPVREKNVLFANPTHLEEVVVVVNSKTSGSENFFTKLADRIKISVVDEDRWQMILEGASRTLVITLASIIFGTLLGFAVYIFYRERNQRANKILDALYRTLQGVPNLVLLMFFYYVVFGGFDLSASVTAVVVFSIVLSISIFTMLKDGEKSISRGQMEAALSLGFSERRAFVKFILPQIVRNFFQQYQLAMNVVLMETAIVGYISVQDLTKVADLIRARTYDAFIPLITITIIYIILSRVLLKVTDLIGRRLDPKNRQREKVLEGVKL